MKYSRIDILNSMLKIGPSRDEVKNACPRDGSGSVYLIYRILYIYLNFFIYIIYLTLQIYLNFFIYLMYLTLHIYLNFLIYLTLQIYLNFLHLPHIPHFTNLKMNMIKDSIDLQTLLLTNFHKCNDIELNGQLSTHKQVDYMQDDVGALRGDAI